MRSCRSSRPSPLRPGGVTPLTVLSLSLLAGVVAIVVDGGSLMEERRHVQATADAAALAAAADLFANYVTNQGADPAGTAQASALATAKSNGYSNDGVQSVVTVNVSPSAYQGGPNAGKALPPGYVEVIVQSNTGRTFSNVFASGAIPVTARAVARGKWAPSSNAVMLLNLKTAGALSITGLGGIKVVGGLEVNSKSASALSLTGLGSVTASQFNLNKAGGLISVLVTALLQGLGGSPPSIVYSGPSPDPLRLLADPDPVALGLSLQATNLSITGGSVDLYPGIYSGGITVTGGTVTLHANANGTPGIYYLQGGGLSVSGAASVTTATGETAGIMLYNDWQNSPADAINLSSSGSLTITPPDSGTYQGISVFQKRGTPGTSAPPISITGGGSANVTGTIYGAYANVTLTGNAGTNVLGGQIIADTLTLNGSATVSVDRGGKPTPNFRTIGLVE